MDGVRTVPTSGCMTDPSDSPVILLFRDDLRLADQAALHAAIETGRPVLPLFILDDAAPDLLVQPAPRPALTRDRNDWALGAASRWWLHHSLTTLQQALTARGSHLTLRQGRCGLGHCGTCRSVRRNGPVHRRHRQSAGRGASIGRCRHRSVSRCIGCARPPCSTPDFRSHQKRRRLFRLHAVRQCLSRTGRPEAACALRRSPYPHDRTRRGPTVWKTGICCLPVRTGRSACATHGRRAKPARSNGPRRS